MTAVTKGKSVMLVSHHDLGMVLSAACQENKDNNAMILAKAASIVRKELSSVEKSTFQGTFTADCQEKSVPPQLLTLVNMILSGPNIKEQSAHPTSRAALSIAQLLKFNHMKQEQERPRSTYRRHSRHQEAHLPVYIGLKIHALTQRKDLIDTFHELGICVS